MPDLLVDQTANYLSELKTLKLKIQRLLDTFMSINAYPPSIENWSVWIEKYTALSAQFHSLQKELGEALRMAIVQPTNAPIHDPEGIVPNVLLRTKLPPTVEQHIIKTCAEMPGLHDSTAMSLLHENLQLLDDQVRMAKRTATASDDNKALLEACVQYIYSK